MTPEEADRYFKRLEELKKTKIQPPSEEEFKKLVSGYEKVNEKTEKEGE
jgi:hypothetical protein